MNAALLLRAKTIIPSDPIGPLRLATVCAKALSLTLPKTVGLVKASMITNKLPAPEYIVNGICGIDIKQPKILLCSQPFSVVAANEKYFCKLYIFVTKV